MSVSTALYQADRDRRNDSLVTTSRMWLRRSADHPDCVIARIEGELDAVGLDDFRTLLARCLRSGCHIVVLDLRATTFMCLRAAAALAGAKQDASDIGVELRLVSGRKDIERALEVVGVRHQFRYFPNLRTSLLT